eukprot:SAG11_NODE_237_length_11835_cov_11.023347_6_plen_42_part_00
MAEMKRSNAATNLRIDKIKKVMEATKAKLEAKLGGVQHQQL